MLTWNLHFGRIDNRAVVTLNGAVIYDSGIINSDPIVNEKVPVTPIIQGENKLNIELFNTSGVAPQNNPWTIEYTLEDQAGKNLSTVNTSIPGIDNPVINDAKPVYKTEMVFNGEEVA